MTIACEHLCCSIEFLEIATGLARAGKPEESEDAANLAGLHLGHAAGVLAERGSGARVTELARAAEALQGGEIFAQNRNATLAQIDHIREQCEAACPFDEQQAGSNQPS